MYSQQIFVNHDFSVKARKRAPRAQADTRAASSVCSLVLVQLCRRRGRERGAGEGDAIHGVASGANCEWVACFF